MFGFPRLNDVKKADFIANESLRMTFLMLMFLLNFRAGSAPSAMYSDNKERLSGEGPDSEYRSELSATERRVDAAAKTLPAQCLLVGCPTTNGVISDWIAQNCACESRLAVDPNAEELRSANLVLIDLGSINEPRVMGFLRELQESGSEACVALLNVRDVSIVDALLEWPAVRGLFSSDLNPPVLIKGIRQLLEGGYWLPREALHRFLANRQRSLVREVVGTSLTRRERQILELLSNARTNRSIAKQLCVSEHTVKTHLYRIFKKIHAKNRMEAMCWAQAHRLEGSGAPV